MGILSDVYDGFVAEPGSDVRSGRPAYNAGRIAGEWTVDPIRVLAGQMDLARDGKPVDEGAVTSAMMQVGMMSPLVPGKPVGGLGTFIGEKGMYNLLGEDAAKGLVSKAEKMAASGVAPEEIKAATNMHKGMDGKWRYEVDDSHMLFKQYPEPVWPMTPSQEKRFKNLSRKDGYYVLPENDRKWLESMRDKRFEYDKGAYTPKNVAEAIEHPDLFKAYPSAGDIKFHVGRQEPGISGYFDDHANKISMHSKDKETLVHELQHFIQKNDGFAEGGSVQHAQISPEDYDSVLSMLKKKIDEYTLNAGGELGELAQKRKNDGLFVRELDRLEQLQKEHEIIGPLVEQMKAERARYFKEVGPLNAYLNTAGEIEARDVSSRMNLTPEQRLNTMPDVRDNAIVRYGVDRGIMSKAVPGGYI